MTWSAFRPSDDACVYGYNVPGNMFASLVLGRLPEIAEASPPRESALIERATQLRAAIEQGLRQHAVVDDPVTGPRWAYEVDGLGGVLEMDDANVPSLLALPRLGYCRTDDPRYVATRAFILSPRNPYYYSVRYGGLRHRQPAHSATPRLAHRASHSRADRPGRRGQTRRRDDTPRNPRRHRPDPRVLPRGPAGEVDPRLVLLGRGHVLRPGPRLLRIRALKYIRPAQPSMIL
jgi:hypothetical protein